MLGCSVRKFSCASCWGLDQALRGADSSLTCSEVGGTAAVLAVGASALRSQAARRRLSAMARARVLRRRAEVIGDPWKVAGSILGQDRRAHQPWIMPAWWKRSSAAKPTSARSEERRVGQE